MARSPKTTGQPQHASSVLNTATADSRSIVQQARRLQHIEHCLKSQTSAPLDPQLAKHLRVARFSEGTLVLTTVTSAWAQRLRMLAVPLLAAVSDAGFGAAHDLQVRIIPAEEFETPPRQRRELSPAARKALDQMARLAKKTSE